MNNLLEQDINAESLSGPSRHKDGTTYSLKDARWFRAPTEDWLAHIISIHFDPQNGSAYWLERERELGIDARHEIRTIEDLQKFGPMVEDDLRRYPMEHFIPKRILEDKTQLVMGETAGTTGRPKATAYLFDEFYAVFVDWFRVVAERRNFPKGCNWLWVGPSGPHIIGKAVGHVARSMGSMEPFSIDFDPRWAKKLKRDSMGYRRYLQHLIEQALNILETQEIGVIFATPPTLLELATKMPEKVRLQIRGIHYGGVSIERPLLKRFKEEFFSNAVHISGYGNTLFGLALEVEGSEEFDLDYYPPGPRMILQVVSTKDGLNPLRERLSRIVDYGEEGQVVFHRLDESFFIPNMFERDKAVRISPSPAALSLGVTQDGVRNPEVMIELRETAKAGFY
ncbi:MAG: hypothetical protein ACE5IC_04900 [Candidatus Brocadiales bacterium]